MVERNSRLVQSPSLPVSRGGGKTRPAAESPPPRVWRRFCTANIGPASLPACLAACGGAGYAAYAGFAGYAGWLRG
ncbi:uncharacterized protein K452DRAFT_285504 [Aplosporella prunicola CBS 121167]|uniref:Uncharacterized protein n=1 Tax=Aplosporella prunicola CBS 121167 TaxID=1176127 RepID=A0A6A6BJB8_9PEZI|nr:uncharacterized protein K452DRAFT_285504 [Aplosporella prunicola CBS 121167]KAF2144260.1 hypothetical protein K452DRAFT_285504 [Aplosporella prunicola CBS 121167]